ncbi:MULTISPECIES: carbon storage regulator CsrA [Oceanobacillus]|uniref:carbon storage regulator CsrA n=1 Tax=Oceanobacillus TaxID=182709 RepID=UPI000A6F7601
MLVLSRKRNESIQIGDDIEIEVIAIEGDQVKLGIRAPKSVDIYRQEIYVDIKNQNNQAAQIDQNLFDFLKGEKL